MRRPRHNGALRLQLESACRANGCSQSALTVLSTRVDPYRLDTPANHRDATWLAEQLERSFGSKNTHWRGLHYSLVMRKRPVKKPDGVAEPAALPAPRKPRRIRKNDTRTARPRRAEEDVVS